jgi:predicted kinase
MNNKKSTLYIFSGLPGSGKTTLAEKLAKFTGAVFLRIDTVEQGLKDICSISKVEADGYRLSYKIAKDNLKIGNNVIADSCNPIQLTRTEWEDIANLSGANFENIEIICSDKKIHRHRIENRTSTIKNLILPKWQDVETREYHLWNTSRHIIDTANKTIEDAFTELIEKLNS